MPSPPRLLAAALVAAAAIALPSPAAADGWSPAAPASSSGASAFALAADASGLNAVWVRGGAVEVARRGANGTFPAPQALPGAGAGLPAIATNAAGRAVAVWVRDGIVHAAVRPAPGEPFGTVAMLSSSGVGQQPRAGVDAAGNVTVAWVRGGLVEIVRRAAGGSWPAPQQLAEAQPANLALAVAPNGAATAVWSAEAGAVWTVRAAARHPGQAAFGAASTLEDAEDAVGSAVAPDVAVDASGAATAVWPNHLLAPFRNPVVRAARRTATGAFGAPATVSDFGVHDDAGSPRAQVAANAAGDALAVWHRRANGVVSLDAVRRLSGVGFEPDVEVAADGVAAEEAPEVALDPQARGVAVWSRGGTIHAARMTDGFGAPSPLSGAGASRPQVVFDAAGTAVAAWLRNGSVETSAYDVLAPQLTAVDVPAAGRAGEDVRVSAAAADGESGVDVTWSFGDGATATGAGATHRYAAAGTYTVTVTATDGGGNAVSGTRTIAIAAADAPGGPAGPAAPREEPAQPEEPDHLVDCGCGRPHVPVAPALSSLRVTARVRRGRPARVGFTLTASARVTFTVERIGKGGRATRLPGSLAVDGREGANTLRFTRLGGRALPPGRYRLAGVVEGGAPLSARFAVVRRR
ncbi:MAG TPA: PKD domain-containing protein [Solirubrobacteraceae bacterium]|nr:PKD domain-containing protein [Solirubrobacteraceae bacterium]